MTSGLAMIGINVTGPQTTTYEVKDGEDTPDDA